jgi:Mg-chelatase subunit ChlD
MPTAGKNRVPRLDRILRLALGLLALLAGAQPAPGTDGSAAALDFGGTGRRAVPPAGARAAEDSLRDAPSSRPAARVLAARVPSEQPARDLSAQDSGSSRPTAYRAERPEGRGPRADAPLVGDSSGDGRAASSPASPSSNDRELAARAGRVLERFARAYASNHFRLDDYARQAGSTEPMYLQGILPEPHPLTMTHADAFGHLARLVAQESDVPGCTAILRLAGFGLLRVRENAPADHDREIRALAKNALGAHGAPRTLVWLRSVAEEEADSLASAAWTGLDLDEQRAVDRASAVLAIAASGQAAFRPWIEDRLKATTAIERLAAARALAAVGTEDSLPALARALAGESNAVVAAELARAWATIEDQGTNAEASTVLARALDAARACQALATALGRTADWRADHAVVDLLARRAARGTIDASAVPALIDVVARPIFADGPRVQTSGGLLRHAAASVLRRATGATLPEDDADAWRRLWEGNADEITGRLRERAAAAAASPPQDGDPSPHTTAGFFGIPVTGRRIVFVIDTSGSMQEPMRVPGEGTTPDRVLPRLTVAGQELWRTVRDLPDETWFRVVRFDHRVGTWRSRPTAAGDGAELALRRWLGLLVPVGGTDLQRALEIALDDLDGDAVDPSRVFAEEVFVLSDGEPSSGRFTNTDEIVAWMRAVHERSRVRVHGIYIGSGDSTLLRRLAEVTGGRYQRP